MTSLRLLLPASIALVALACTSSNPDNPAPAADAGDGGSTETTARVSCEKDPRVDTYVANLSKASASGAFKVTLISSEPAPPARGTNTWKVRVTDGSGAPLSNAALTITPFMPDHGHPSSIRAVATAEAEPGVYTIAPVYFFMAGVWRVTIAMPASGDAGSAPESVELFFCVPG